MGCERNGLECENGRIEVRKIMEVVISTIVGAILLIVLFYIGIVMVDARLSLDIRKEKKVPVSIGITGVMTFLGWCAVCLDGRIYEDKVQLFLTFLLICGMAVLNVTDLERHIIPNLVLKVMLFLWIGVVGCYLIFHIEYGISLFLPALAGGLISGIAFMMCYVLSRKQLGAGDVKLVFVMGLYLTGQKIMGVLVYGMLLCCVYSIIQLCRKKIGWKDGVPLTPFLYLGTLITLFIL